MEKEKEHDVHAFQILQRNSNITFCNKTAS